MSNWHITINFNTADEEIVVRFREAVEKLVDDEYLGRWLKHYVDGKQEDFEGEDWLLVDSVSLRAAFENKGAHNKGVHCHVLVEVLHQTQVQVSKKELCVLLHELVGKNPNVNCRLLKGNSEDTNFILRYITKEVVNHNIRHPGNTALAQAFATGDEVEAENLAPSGDSTKI